MLIVITEEALTALNLPADGWDKDNKKLIKEFNRRWEAWELGTGDNQPALTGSNDPRHKKQERWALRELMSNPVYNDWYRTLPGPLRRALNHPNAIINKYKATHNVTPRKPPGTAKKELEKKLEQKDAFIAEIEAARDDGDRFKRTDTAKDIATCLVGMFKPGKAREIANYILAMLKQREVA